MIVLATARLVREFANLQHPLPEIVADLLETYRRQYFTPAIPPDACALPMNITSIYRTPEEDLALGGSGIHCTIPHRAIDIAMSWEWVTRCARVINRRWVL